MKKEQKVFEVCYCDLANCPFRAFGNPKTYCKLIGETLTSTVFPIPQHCPLRENEVVVKLKSVK